MHIFKNILVVIFLWPALPALWCQVTATSSFKNLGIWQGLPLLQVTDITEDDQGFIWISTEAGLVRYDGYSCLPFSPCATSNLDQDGIFAASQIVFDHQHTLWIGTIGHGIFYKPPWSSCFLPIVFSKNPNEFAHTSVTSIAVDSYNRVWFGTNNLGLYLYDPKKGKLEKFEIPLTQQIVDIEYCETTREMWIMTALDKVLSIRENDFSNISTHDLPFSGQMEALNIFSDLKFAPDNTVWYVHEKGGLYFMHLEKGIWHRYKSTSVLRDTMLNHITIGQKGEIYLPIEIGGLYVIYPNEDRFEYVPFDPNDPEKLNMSGPNAIYLSKNNDIWLGGFPNGVEVHYSKSIKTSRIAPVSSDNLLKNKLMVLSILADPKDGSFWLGTEFQGLYKFNPKTNEFKRQNLYPDHAPLKTLYKDQKGLIWMGFWGVGMRCYNPETKKLTYYNSTEKGPYQLEGLNVWDFEEDQAGNFWVASLGAGLVRFSKNGSEREVFFKSSATSQLKILDLMCDSKGTLWVAFEDNGIAYKGNNDLTFTHIDNKETGLNSKYTQCLFEDSKGNIWVGTKSQGINLFVNGHFKALTMKEGLIANDIQSIFEDNNGHIWASSTKGFSRITLRDGETTGIITIESPDENPITHRTSCKDSDGHLYVGGLKGLNKIEILYDEQSHTPPKALIANIRTKFDILENHNYELLYQIISNNGIIELPKGDQDIIIDFACPDMSDTHMVQYQYQFSEQGEQWKTLYNGDRHVVFTNLGGGTYTLKFRCKTGFSDWGEANQIQIKISVPFYRSPVFLVILGLIILLLSIFILLLRNYSRLANTKRKLLEAETQRLKNTASDLAEQVNVKDSQIMAKSAEMALKTEKLTGMLDSIGSHKDPTNTTQALRSIANKMHAELKSDEEWDTFKIYFDKANQNFTKKLLQQYPQLTANDIRICMLIRLKMSTKEIAQMLNITVMGVQKNRYRMKKRMHLDEAEDLQSFLLNFKVDEEPKNLNNGV